MSDLTHSVLRYVRRHGLLAPGQGVVVGLSGGPDSVALTLVLARLAARDLPMRLHLAHLDHGLRGSASEQDAEFCRRFADEQGLPIRLERKDVAALAEREGRSLEAVARDARYRFLGRVAADLGADAVATGHHADDVAETVLMRLIRGTGVGGLAAIRPRRPLNREQPDVSLVRPLLEVRKADLLAFLGAAGQPFRRDETNRDTGYTRNRVRHVLLPALQRDFRAFSIHSLCALSAAAADVAALIEELTDERWPALCVEAGPDGVSLAARGLARAPGPVRKAACARALALLTGGRPPALRAEHYEDLCGIAARPVGAQVGLPGGLMARREHGLVHFRRDVSLAPLPCRRLEVPGELEVPEIGVRITSRRMARGPEPDELAAGAGRCEAYLDASALAAPLSVRSRRPGDRFHPLGAPGGHRLKQFFIDRKIPCHERDRIPLVTTRDGRVAWVVGHEIGEGFRVWAGGRPAVHLAAVRGAGHEP